MTLIPQRYNLFLWKGATFRVRLTLWEDDEETTPVPLADYSAELVIRDRAGGIALFTLSTDNDKIALDDDGHIDLLITDEETADLDWSRGVYDLTLTSVGGDTDAYLFGSVVVKTV